MAGINLFATGGLGGVHRGVSDTWDISADLEELARHPVVVVSSGVKSILDVPKTLEYLETKGVSVVSYQSENFPNFYTNSGLIKSPNSCHRLEDLVRALKFVMKSGLSSGMLIANPVPNEIALDDGETETIINEAMLEAETLCIKGKNVTPFILEKMRQKTKDRSLDANLALVYNNIKLACQIASLATKQDENFYNFGEFSRNTEKDAQPIKTNELCPLIIGGINIDISIKAQTQLSAASNASRISLTLGGVGRNVAEVLHQLGTPPTFVSALGDDQMGRFARSHFSFDDSYVLTSKTFPTSVYTLVLQEETSDVLYGFTQNEIRSSIDPKTILKHETKFQSTNIVLLDANIHQVAARTVFELCKKYDKPLLFEPTDYKGCQKMVQMFLEFPCVCKFATPNFKELFTLNETLKSAKLSSQNIETKEINFDKCVQLDSQVTEDNCLKIAEEYSTELLNFVDVALVSFGSIGVVAASRNFSSLDLETLSQSSQRSHEKADAAFFLFRALKCDSIGSCSGAGDSFVGGFVHQNIFEGKDIADSVLYGLKCAYSSLLTTEAVNGEVKHIANSCNLSIGKTHEC